MSGDDHTGTGELDLDAMRGDPGPPPGEDRTAEEYLVWAVRHWRHRARTAESEVRRLRAKVERVAALADQWERVGGFLPSSQMQRLRAALRDE